MTQSQKCMLSVQLDQIERHLRRIAELQAEIEQAPDKAVATCRAFGACTVVGEMALRRVEYIRQELDVRPSGELREMPGGAE